MSWKNKFINKSPVRQNGDPTKPGSFNNIQSGSYGVKPTVKTKASTRPLTKKPITKEELDRQSFEFSQKAKDRNTGGIASGVGGMVENDPKAAEFAASWAPGTGEIIDAKDVVVDLKSAGSNLIDGKFKDAAYDMGGAAISAAGFAIPFVPGKAIKKFFGYGGDAAKKAPPPKTVDKSTGFNTSKNPSINKIDNVDDRFLKERTRYGNTLDGKTEYEIARNALNDFKQRGKTLDEDFGYFDYNDLKAQNVKWHGTTPAGRTVVEVELPNGENQLMYKSSGLANKKGSGVGGTTEGIWQPYGGEMNAPGHWFDRTEDGVFKPGRDTDDWMIKDAGYETFYDSDSYKKIADRLKNLEGHWDMSKQVYKSQQ